MEKRTPMAGLSTWLGRESVSWRVLRGSEQGEGELLIEPPGESWLLLVKDVRSDRRPDLKGVLAQALLEVRAVAAAHSEDRRLWVVIGMPGLKSSWIQEMVDYRDQVASEIALGAVDREGQVWIEEAEWARQIGRPIKRKLHRTPNMGSAPASLFSDLNQWLLKCLLGQSIIPELIAVPRESWESMREFAQVSHVAPATVHRFVKVWEAEGQVIRDGTSMVIVKPETLLLRWSTHAMPQPEFPAWYRLNGAPEILFDRLRKHGGKSNRWAIGLYAGARALGFGHVSGTPLHLYLERWDEEIAADLRLTTKRAGRAADLMIRVARSPEAVFRAAVQSDDLWVCDVLQVWLDVVHHPTRGREQARVLEEGPLRALLGNAPE